MEIVAFDLSLTKPGVCSGMDAAQAIKVPDLRGVPRLIWLRDQVLELSAGADLVVMEGYAHGRVLHAHSLGELGGVVKVALFEAGRPCVLVPPAKRAKYATGKGNAAKPAVMSAWSARTGLTFADDNACDAHILWSMAADHYGLAGAVKVPALNREVIDGVPWPIGARG